MFSLPNSTVVERSGAPIAVLGECSAVPLERFGAVQGLPVGAGESPEGVPGLLRGHSLFGVKKLFVNLKNWVGRGGGPGGMPDLQISKPG